MTKENSDKNGVSEVCRLCHSSMYLLSMFSGKARARRDNMRKMIEEVIDIRIEHDNRHCCVCINCCIDVLNIFRFKWSCHQNEEKFQSKLQSSPSLENQKKKIKLQSPQLKDLTRPTLSSSEDIMAWLLKKRSDISSDVEPSSKDIEIQMDDQKKTLDLVSSESQTDIITDKSFLSNETQTEGVFILKPEIPIRKNKKTQTNDIKIMNACLPTKKKSRTVSLQTDTFDNVNCGELEVKKDVVASKNTEVVSSCTRTEGIHVAFKADRPETNSCKTQTDKRRTENRTKTHHKQIQTMTEKNAQHKQFIDRDMQTIFHTIDASSATDHIDCKNIYSQTHCQDFTNEITENNKGKSKMNRLSLKTRSASCLNGSLKARIWTDPIKADSKSSQTENACCLDQSTQTDIGLNGNKSDAIGKQIHFHFLNIGVQTEDTYPTLSSCMSDTTSIETPLSIGIPLSTPEKLCEPRRNVRRRLSKCKFNDAMNSSKDNFSDLSPDISGNSEIKKEEIKEELPSPTSETEILSPCSSGLLDIDTTKIVQVCKYCDKLLSTKVQANFHEKSHKQCKFCRRKFPSILHTINHGKVCKIKNMTSKVLYVYVKKLEDDIGLLKKYPNIASELTLQTVVIPRNL